MTVILHHPHSPECGWLFSLPQAEASDEGSKIRHHWRDSRGIAAGTWHNSKKGLPGLLPSMAEMLGPLYSCKRGVLPPSPSKVMEEFNIQGKETYFYKYCPGTFGYILVYCSNNKGSYMFPLQISHHQAIYVRSIKGNHIPAVYILLKMIIWRYLSLTCTGIWLLHVNPYPTAFPYGNGMVLHFYQQQESSTTKTVHKVINKGLKTYVLSLHTGENFH